jgi:hypothetical protein
LCFQLFNSFTAVIYSIDVEKSAFVGYDHCDCQRIGTKSGYQRVSFPEAVEPLVRKDVED